MNNEGYADAAPNYPISTLEGAAKSRRTDITLRQNIDTQIAQAEERVSTLKETKERMEASGILDMRIDDIQRAMRF